MGLYNSIGLCNNNKNIERFSCEENRPNARVTLRNNIRRHRNCFKCHMSAQWRGGAELSGKEDVAGSQDTSEEMKESGDGI